MPAGSSSSTRRRRAMPASKRTKVQSLRRKRIKGCIAKDPKRQNDDQQHPDVFGVKPGPLEWLAAHSRVGVAQECVKQKRQRQDHQRIQFKSRNHVAMKQPVQSARAAATRTSKSRNRAEGTNRKEARFSRFENKEISSPECQCQPNKSDRHSPIYYLSKRHQTTKLTRQRPAGNGRKVSSVMTCDLLDLIELSITNIKRLPILAAFFSGCPPPD